MLARISGGSVVAGAERLLGKGNQEMQKGGSRKADEEALVGLRWDAGFYSE